MASFSNPFVYKRQSGTNFNDIHANISSNNAYKFAHGLTGTDQPGNWRFTTILFTTFLALATLGFLFRLGNYLYRIVREKFVIEYGQSQKCWERGHFPWLSKTLQHSTDRPLRPGHRSEISLTKSLSLGFTPTRNQVFFTVFYIIINTVFLVIIPWKPIHAENIAALRGRSGHLAVFNLIFVTLFASRNNPFIWLLQTSFDTFNYYHRLCARIAIAESLIHVICWAANTISAGGQHGLHLALESSLSYQWGMASFIAFMIILIQTWSPIRRAWYNLFITLHRVLAVIAIISIFLHIHYHDLPQIIWASIILVLLTAEMVYRMIRIVFLNFRLSGSAGTRVTIEALPGASRVTWHLNRSWRPPPGTHVHIYIPSVSLVTSHPFSVAWSHDNGLIHYSNENESQIPLECIVSPSTPISRLSTNLTGTKSSNHGELPAGSTEVLLPHHNSSKAQPKTSLSPTISLIVRARDGFTQKLHRLASRTPNGIYETWGLVEGTYGIGHSLRSYGTVVLVAGGVGITHVMPYIRDLVMRRANKTGAIQRLKLVWTVPNIEMVEWVQDWLEEVWGMESAAETLRIEVYVSRGGDGMRQKVPHWVEIKSGRCDVDAVVEEEVRDRIGAMAVMVCGPSGVAESARLAVRKRMTDCSIDLFEEAFTY